MPGSSKVTDGQSVVSEDPPGRAPGERPGQCPDLCQGVTRGICVAALCGGAALGGGATQLTCGSSGPQHSPPQPPSSLPPSLGSSQPPFLLTCSVKYGFVVASYNLVYFFSPSFFIYFSFFGK